MGSRLNTCRGLLAPENLFVCLLFLLILLTGTVRVGIVAVIALVAGSVSVLGFAPREDSQSLRWFVRYLLQALSCQGVAHLTLRVLAIALTS